MNDQEGGAVRLLVVARQPFQLVEADLAGVEGLESARLVRRLKTAEMALEVLIRDPNFDQTLEYRIFLDSPPPPEAEFAIQQGDIEPTGFLERPRSFAISYDELAPGECHKIELVVVGQFASNV